MARLTSAQATGSSLRKLLGILASGTNPDGTSYALPTSPPAPAAANVLNGRQVFTATTAATTLITVPAGRTWVGTIGASVAVTLAAAAATAAVRTGAEFSIAGAGATPAAGTHFGVDALLGPHAATGTSGSGNSNHGSMPLIVVAPAGNAVTVQVAASIVGTAGRVDAYASGQLL